MYAMRYIDSKLGYCTYDGKNRAKFLEETFQLKNLDTSIRQLMIPAFDIDSEATIWFDSYHGTDREKKLLSMQEIQNQQNKETNCLRY